MNKKQANQLINKVNQIANRPKAKGSKRKKNKGRKQMVRSSCPLSKCAIEYLRARENPFTGKTSCVPNNFNTPSQRVFIRIRGSLVTGTNGFGGIVFAPGNMKYNNGGLLTGDPPAPVLFTQSTYTGTALPIYNTPNIALANGNISFATGNYNGRQISARLVSAGLRVRNITPLMYRGGSVIGVEEPSHLPLLDRNFSQIQQIQNSEVGDASGQWNSVVFHPVDETELEYSNSINANSQYNSIIDTISLSKHFLGFAIECPVGTPLTPQQYEFEAVASFECNGQLATGLQPAPSDVVGIGMVQTLTSSNQSRKPHVGERDGWIDHLIDLASRSPFTNSLVGTAALSGSALLVDRRQRSRLIQNSPLVEEIDF
jgi:hypothetical protein